MSRRKPSRRPKPIFKIAVLLSLLVAIALGANATTVQLTPWITYHRAWVQTAAGRTQVDYLIVRDYQEHYRLEAALPPGGIGTLASVGELVRQRGAVAGIDANFFDPNTDLPIGLIIHEGRVLNTPYGRRAVLGIDLFGHIEIFNARITLYLRTPQGELKLSGVNQPPGGPGFYFYTKEYAAPLYPPADSLLYEVQAGQVVGRFTGARLGPDTELLLAIGEEQIAILTRELKPGDPVSVGCRVTPPLYLPLREAISAGPLLIEHGELITDYQQEGFDAGFTGGRAARSAIGITGDGALVLLIAGRAGGGMTLRELALFLTQLDVVEALALDGGSSASLVFRQGLTLRELGTRRVAVGLVLIAR